LSCFYGYFGINFILKLTLGDLVEFEFDPEKSQENREKHGIDFIDAQQLWLDDMLLGIQARTIDEPRFLILGRIKGKHWSAVVTYRHNRTRIISVRRSRDEEVELYESK
jgi:uncharacterized DUF497 family protein